MQEIEINGEVYVKKNNDVSSRDELHYVETIANEFKKMGYNILTCNKTTKHGPDLYIQKDDLVLRVEAKKARPSKTGNSMLIHPVEHNRKDDDLLAVFFPSGYILIEPMKDHLLSCSDYGSRSFYGVL